MTMTATTYHRTTLGTVALTWSNGQWGAVARLGGRVVGYVPGNDEAGTCDASGRGVMESEEAWALARAVGHVARPAA